VNAPSQRDRVFFMRASVRVAKGPLLRLRIANSPGHLYPSNDVGGLPNLPPQSARSTHSSAAPARPSATPQRRSTRRETRSMRTWRHPSVAPRPEQSTWRRPGRSLAPYNALVDPGPRTEGNVMLGFFDPNWVYLGSIPVHIGFP